MSRGYEQLAVAGVLAALADETTGLVAQLRAVETADSLDANTLPDPEAFVAAQVPTDPRSPLVQVYDEASENSGSEWRNRIAGVDVTIGVTYNGDADLEAAELVMRRYVRAVRMVFDADPTCGGIVGQVWITDANRSLEITYDSVTRHGRYLGALVRVHDP